MTCTICILAPTFFFIFIVFTLFLNLIKNFLIQDKKKKEILQEKCEYLETDNYKQECKLDSQRTRFHKNGDSCKECPGKTVKISDVEIENRVKTEKRWKNIVVLLANITGYMLPYISFLYTLAVTIFENNT